MRLIDADDRIEFIKNAYCPECDNYNGVRCRACPINDMIEAIDDAPTVDLWHYPSKGELPTEGETVLVAFQEGGLWYFANAEYHEGGWASVVDLGNIVAWQNIIPPKEEA